MTLKRYKTVKLALAAILAIIFGQAMVYKNYVIPLAALLTGWLILMMLRRRVTEIIADERDYATGGKAALLTIQIYAWVATVTMFVMYAWRDTEPAYGPIALTLAFSTCILMTLYGLIFHYYNRSMLKSNKQIAYAIFMIVILTLLTAAGLRLISGEDTWRCQNGQWVMHGRPSAPMPARPCIQ